MANSEGPMISSEAERARGVLTSGVTIFRIASLAWMTALAATGSPSFSRPVLAWIAVGVAAAWTAWLTPAERQRSDWTLWVDLAIAFGMILVSGVVVPDGAIDDRPLLATGWPLAAVLAWGIGGGPVTGLLSGALLGAGLFLARSLNGIAPAELSFDDMRSVVNGTISFLLAGGAVGLVAQLFERSARQFESVLEESVRAREDAARSAERETLARAIHDSVLQALALVHKRGKELASRGTVAGEEVAELADMAARQEDTLRSMILREPEEAPGGTASLRDLLEATARDLPTLPVSVSAVGPIWMPAHPAHELARAVRQALDNVAEHANATKVIVFVDIALGWVTVTVRDDGAGFVYDEERFHRERKAGMLMSMKGRVEALGGRMVVVSAPGRGTEIEFHVPLEDWLERLRA